MSHILIYGADSLLGSYCAARMLQRRDSRIHVAGLGPVQETYTLVLHAASELSAGGTSASGDQDLKDRLFHLSAELHVNELNHLAASGIETAWYFAPPETLSSGAAGLEGFVASLPAIGIKEFNYVVFDLPPAGSSVAAKLPDRTIAEFCAAHDIRFRIFHTSLIVGQVGTALGLRGAFAEFLGELHSFKTEIQERSVQYFDFHALRCFAPADAALNLLPASLASELLLRISDSGATLDRTFPVAHPEPVSFAALCEHISMVYDVGLLPVEEPAALNAIDRAFQERISGFQKYLGGPLERPSTEAYFAAGISPEGATLSEDALAGLLETISRLQDEQRAAREERAQNLPSMLTSKTVVAGGSDLEYYVGGTAGPVVVLLNALGQGLQFWHRLILELIETHRVIIWEPRGTISPCPPFGLVDQVNDLDAVLQNEKIQSCHLVGWCTGPKVAIDFYLKRPEAVLSMAFLNVAFKCNGGPEEFSSPYLQNLEFLLRRLVHKPAIAASVMKTFQSPPQENEAEILEGDDAEERSARVLGLVNRHLKSAVLAPFQSEETTVNYAHQLVDFWSSDVRPKAPQVRIPVLLMSAEHDGIVSPAGSQMAARLFPDARHVHVAAANHYCLYDRADFVAALLKQFFENPDTVQVVEPAEEEVAVES